MKTKHILILLIFLSSLFATCKKPVVYPKEPKIDFLQIIVKDTTDGLGNTIKNFSIYFKVFDGDGDFGIMDNDTLVEHYGDSIYKNNFFITLYYQGTQGDTLVYPLEMDLNGAIPWSEPVGINQYYKATVIWDLQVPKLPQTLLLKFYVIDRHLNKSNEQQTPWIEQDFRGVMVDTTVIIK